LIDRQARSVLIDSFANAFNYNASGEGHQDDIRKPPMTPSVFEGKYEIDSLGAFLKLSYWYYAYTNSTTFMNSNWYDAVSTTISTIQTMIDDDGNSVNPPYLFQRETTVATDTLMMSGRGPAAHPNGLTRSLFRPSDDAVTLPYNIPGNAMACTELNHLMTMVDTTAQPDIYNAAQQAANQICTTLDNMVAQAQHNPGRQALPYEVDGFGSEYFMDDANVPSLLSLPVLGYIDPDHPVYKQTRKFVLSHQNPFYFSGTQGEGVGGPHVGYDFAWPMSVTLRAMTSTSDEEVQACLDLLLRSADGTGLMHESFNVNDLHDYTRSWFAWANGLFGEMILQLVLERPHLLIKADNIAQAQQLVKTPISMRAQQEPYVSE